jgi:hypothetical protein
MRQWACPDCGRKFGHARQSHECTPGSGLAAYLAGQPAARRATYEAVLAVLRKLGEIDVDPVRVGIMIKRARTFCELRPKRDAVELSFKLSRPLESPRVRRTIRSSTHRFAHFVHLHDAAEVDAEIAQWLAEAWLASPD